MKAQRKLSDVKEIPTEWPYSTVVAGILGDFQRRAQTPNSLSITPSSLALGVSRYSTLGGICGYIFLEIRPSRSISNNLAANTVLLIPGSNFLSSLKRTASFV